jgi:hypothetical protein
VTARDTTSSGGGAAAGVPDAAEYGPEALKGWDPAQRLGTAGSFPFTRHIHPGGAASRPPAPSLYSGFGTPEDANRRFCFLIERGNARANCAVDLPTQIGLGSDDPDALGEVGRVGVAIDSLEDVVTMFDGVPLDRTPVSFNVNAVGPVILAMLIATARRQGVDEGAISGTLSNDGPCIRGRSSTARHRRTSPVAFPTPSWSSSSWTYPSSGCSGGWPTACRSTCSRSGYLSRCGSNASRTKSSCRSGCPGPAGPVTQRLGEGGRNG